MAAEKNNASPEETPLAFEQALEGLEQVVNCLEEGQTGLSDSLARYEQGVKLLRQCYDLLAQAERKIEVLAGFDAQGNPVTEPLADDAGQTLEEKAANRSRRRSQSSTKPRPPKPPLEDDPSQQDIPF